MARNEEGGVLTQKVKAFGIVAIMLMAATCLCFVASSDDTDAMNVDGAVTYVETGGSTTFTLTDYETALYYTAELIDENDIAQTSAISTSYQKSQLSDPYSNGVYSKSITVTCPSESGDYRMHVMFYKDADYTEFCGEKYTPLKVVDPITLKVTIKNTGSTEVSFTAYFKINGEKVDDSEQTVKVSAGSTADVTYDYIVWSPSKTTYSLCTDDETINSVISGLGEEKTFYTEQKDSTLLTVVAVVVIVVLVIVLILVLRKPVVNKGKPKGRR